jgi:hypothetical protein
MFTAVSMSAWANRRSVEPSTDTTKNLVNRSKLGSPATKSRYDLMKPSRRSVVSGFTFFEGKLGDRSQGVHEGGGRGTAWFPKKDISSGLTLSCQSMEDWNKQLRAVGCGGSIKCIGCDVCVVFALRTCST